MSQLDDFAEAMKELAKCGVRVPHLLAAMDPPKRALAPTDEHPAGMTAAEWNEKASRRTGRPLDPDRMVVPCGPDTGCDYDHCEGWSTSSREDYEMFGYGTPPVAPEVRRRSTKQIAADAAKRRRELGA